MIEAVLIALGAYATLFCVVQLGLHALAVIAMWRYAGPRRTEVAEFVMTNDAPPLTVIVPAYNEEATVVSSVHSILQLRYPALQVIVVNDGSKDATLAKLEEAFGLEALPMVFQRAVPTQQVRGIYRAGFDRRLRVIDKQNGGKADSLNAGINLADTPLVCAVDADSVLERDSLLRVVRPFLDDPTVVASGGTVQIANGCVVDQGLVTRVGLPDRLLPLFQFMEYLRGIMVSRLGWDRLNALVIISGAFGVFRRDAVLEVGGYRTDTVGEDMELVLRLHRVMSERGEDYAVRFVPDPVCWTEAPEDLRTLRNQRIRWHRGLIESLLLNRSLFFSPRALGVGWLGLPNALLFEWLSPLIEAIGYLFTAWIMFTGRADPDMVLLFALYALLLALVLDVSAILVDAIAFRTCKSGLDAMALIAVGLLENFGYRQMLLSWRLKAMYQSLTKQAKSWGEMQRGGRWQQPT